MSHAAKYRKYAEECKRIARGLAPDQKQALLEIAEAWIGFAEKEEDRDRGRTPSNGGSLKDE